MRKIGSLVVVVLVAACGGASSNSPPAHAGALLAARERSDAQCRVAYHHAAAQCKGSVDWDECVNSAYVALNRCLDSR